MAVASDLEGTLTKGETWRALGRYLLKSSQKNAYRKFFAARFPAAVFARLGLKDKRAFQNHWLEQVMQFFEGMPVQAFDDLAAWVVETELWPKRREDVIAALKVHQAAGESLVLVSATYQPVLEQFAQRLQAKALGTALEIHEGHLTGRLKGEVNVGELKAARLHDWLGKERLYAAYGDTEADEPMLMLSDKPVAVYPDKHLRRTAESLNWSLLEGMH